MEVVSPDTVVRSWLWLSPTSAMVSDLYLDPYPYSLHTEIGTQANPYPSYSDCTCHTAIAYYEHYPFRLYYVV